VRVKFRASTERSEICMVRITVVPSVPIGENFEAESLWGSPADGSNKNKV
jgi:hypothetical protein